MPPELRCRQPDNTPHSAWDLVEHIRLAQEDIIEFTVDPDYEERTFPDDYWPDDTDEVSDEEWFGSMETIQSDRDRMIDIVQDPSNDLLEPIPHGDGQTVFREAMLIVDHRSYHVGQIVTVRQALGDWN